MIQVVNTGKQKFEGFFTRQLKEVLETPTAPYTRNQVIRPSQILECRRFLVGDLVGLSPFEDISAHQHKIFDNGTYVHKRYLQKYIPRMGNALRIFDVKAQKVKPFIEITLLDTEYWLKGAPDAVILNRVLS